MVILIIEDDISLAELVIENLEGSGFTTVHISSARNAIEWLSKNKPYMMIMDFSLPEMNGREFISELKKKELSLPPFIVSTGRGDERIAVDMMKLGARDYIVKDSNFWEKLPEIIKRVGREIENENKLKEAEAALRESEEKYRILIERSSDPIFSFDSNGTYKYANPAFAEGVDKPIEEIIGKTLWDIFPKDIADTRYTRVENRYLVRDAEQLSRESFREKTVTGFILRQYLRIKDTAGNVITAICSSKDISERKKAEEKIQSLLAEKEIILQEVHHRIKNNMSSINSLLNLQAGTTKDPAAVAALKMPAAGFKAWQSCMINCTGLTEQMKSHLLIIFRHLLLK